MIVKKAHHFRLKWIPFFTAITFCIFSLASAEAFGVASTVPNHGKRGRVIDFDDDVVEGMNKRPLDSLSQVSERDRKLKKPHLYRKRIGYQTEDRLAVRNLRYAQ